MSKAAELRERAAKIRESAAYAERSSDARAEIQLANQLIREADALDEREAMMNEPGPCSYCNGVGVVGGRMPEGTHTAMPCAYCHPKAGNPVLTFKAVESPMIGIAVKPEIYSPDKHATWTCWLEPELPGIRMVAVVDPKYRTYLWSEDGLCVEGTFPLIKLRSELAELAMDLRWVGDKAWAAGVVLEIIYTPTEDNGLIQAHVYHAMPFTALLGGADVDPIGLRQATLREAFDASRYSLLALPPHKQVTTRPQLDQQLLDDACKEWGVSSLLIKQTFGRWGESGCWLRYVEDF